MKKLFIIFVAFFSVTANLVCNEKKYEQQEKEGLLLGDRYAAQVRQNCNHVLVSIIMPLVEQKGSLLDSEKERLNRAFKLYEIMKCSEKSLFELYSYDEQLKK